MSYPWWKLRVTFSNGEVRDYISDGLTVMDAIRELAHDDDFMGGPTAVPHEVAKVEFMGMADGVVGEEEHTTLHLPSRFP